MSETVAIKILFWQIICECLQVERVSALGRILVRPRIKRLRSPRILTRTENLTQLPFMYLIGSEFYCGIVTDNGSCLRAPEKNGLSGNACQILEAAIHYDK